jgi:DNA-binding CsgD family transcriptional regulator
MPANLVAAVETMYATEVSTDEWLRRVAETCRPIIDLHGLGIVAGFYSCPDPSSFAPTAAFMCGLADNLQAVFAEMLATLSPVFVADAFLSRAFFLGSDVRGWDDVAPVRSGAMRDCGASDSIHINAIEPDGGGCWICSPLVEKPHLTDEAHITLARLARHLAVANRLKRKHRHAVLTEKDAEKPPGLGWLSPREREVVIRALRGDDNKVIAYDLGLAPSTVRVLLVRASTKIGARSRKELLAKAASLLDRDWPHT